MSEAARAVAADLATFSAKAFCNRDDPLPGPPAGAAGFAAHPPRPDRGASREGA